MFLHFYLDNSRSSGNKSARLLNAVLSMISLHLEQLGKVWLLLVKEDPYRDRKKWQNGYNLAIFGFDDMKPLSKMYPIAGVAKVNRQACPTLQSRTSVKRRS